METEEGQFGGGSKQERQSLRMTLGQWRDLGSPNPEASGVSHGVWGSPGGPWGGGLRYLNCSREGVLQWMVLLSPSRV